MLNLTVTDNPGERLDRWLSARLPDRTRSQIQNDLTAERIAVNGEPRPARYKVREGDTIAYDVPAEADSTPRAEAIELEVLYEDDHMLALNKPVGLVVQPAPGHETGTLVNALLAHCGESIRDAGGPGRCGIVHRLDADTSGVMLAAKTPEAGAALTAAIARRAVRRTYVAVVVGQFNKEDGGTVEGSIGRRKGDRKKMGMVRDGRPARTDWRLLYQLRGLALLGLTLHTGRTHQIRVHMQHIGRPVLGDAVYGFSRKRTMINLSNAERILLAPIWPKAQMLHATLLRLTHPVVEGMEVCVTAPPPAGMEQILRAVFGAEWEPGYAQWIEELKAAPLPEGAEVEESIFSADDVDDEVVEDDSVEDDSVEDHFEEE